MGSNPLPSHFQWSSKVFPAGEGGLQLEISVWLPGLEQLQPFTWVPDSFPVGSKMAFVSTHACDVHQAAQLDMEVVQIHVQVSASERAVLARNLSIHKDFIATKGFPDFFRKK